MSIRQDQAQLIITIDSKESVEYQKSVERSAELVRNMKKLEVGTDEYNAALREQIEISKRLSGQDYSKLSLKNLTDRKKALQDQIRILPQAQAAELGLERELQRVNQALATNAQRTRAVSQEMGKGSIGLKGFLAAYVGIGALKAFGVELFEQIKKINSLNAAYKLLIPETDKRARADAFLTRLAGDYGLELTKLRDEYIKYNASAKASNLTLKDQELVFESVAKAGAVLGLSTETQGRAFTALQQIMSKGKVSAEELKGQLGDALPGAVTIMAKALGVGTGELQKMLEKGEVMADDALPKFARELQKAYGVDQVKTIENLASAQSRSVTESTKLITVIGDKVGPLFTRLFNGLAGATKKMTEFISPTKTAAEQTRLLQNEFNSEIGVLRRLAPEAEGRKEIIDQINIKYKDYLPNLIKESDSIDDITRAQKLANDAFQQKILLLVLEENLEKVKEKRLRAERLQTGAAVSTARTQQANEDLGKIGATPAQLEAQKNISKQFIDVTVQGAKTLINEATKDEEDYIKAAEARAIEFNTTLEDIRKRFAPKDDGNTRGSGGGTGGSSEKSDAEKKAEKEAEKLLKKKLELQAKERDALLKFNPLNPEFAQGVLDLRLKMLEEAADREQVVLEESYLQGKISLEQYELDKLRITSANLSTRIELLDAFGQTETDKRRELNVELLKVDKDLMAERAAQIADMENLALSDVEQRFAERLISEEEYNLSRLKVQLNFYDEQLRMLEESELTNDEVYKKIQEERLKTQIDYNNQKIDNEKRTAAMQEAIQRDGVDAAKDIFSLGAELLGQDEKARKKHATAIKAFESSAILINALSEISAIHKKYAAIPGGTIVAIGQSIATAVRAGIAIAKVNSQKFAYGGTLRDGGVFQGASHQYGGVKFSVGGEINEAEGGETIINKRSSQVFARELDYINSYKGYGRRLFNDGGIVRLPNTQPSLSSGVINPQQILSAPDGRLDMLMGIVSEMAAAVSSIPGTIAGMNLKTHVVYSDLQGAQSTVDEIKRLASY